MMATAKQQAASNRRSLRKIRERLVDMSANWSDVDQYFVSRLDELADKVEQLNIEMGDFITVGGNDAS